MPSPLRTRDRKKHTLLGLSKIEEWGSSGFRTKKLKREDGVKQWTGKPREHCERIEPDLEPVRLVRKTMDARAYKSMFKRQQEKDKSAGSYGVSTGSSSQILPLAPDIVPGGGIRSHDMQKSVEDRLKLDILKLCQVLRLPEDVRVMVGKFIEYVICKHEVTREPETKLEAFEISLCWNAASLLKYKIDKRESLSLAKQHLLFGCSVEELSDVDSTLRKLRKTFVIDVGNVKELESSKPCISAIKEATKDQEQPPKSCIDEKEFLRCTKKVEQKLEKRMKELAGKQQKEIDEFHRIWGKRKVQIMEQHSQRTSLVSSSHDNSAVIELKRLDDELKKKMEQHNNRREIRLKDLTAHHLAKKSKMIGKKGRWLEKMKPSGQVEKSMVPSRKAKMTSSQEQVPNGPQSTVEEVIEGAKKGLFGDLHRSGNDSENNFAAKVPSSEKQLRNEPPSSVEEVIKGTGFGLVPGSRGSGNTSQACSSQEKLPNGPQSNIKEVIEGDRKVIFKDSHRSGNDSENNFAAKAPSSENQFRNEPPSSVEEVIKGAVFGLVPGLGGSGNTLQTCSSQEQLPNGPQSNVKERIEGARKVLFGDLHRSGNDSENNFAAKSPSSVEQLRNEPPSSVEEVIKSTGFGLVPGSGGSGNTSQACCSQEQLFNGPHSNVKKVIEGAGKVSFGDFHRSCNYSESDFAAKSPSSEEQLRNEPPSSVEEVIKESGFGLVPGLDGPGNTSQTCSSRNNFATTMPSSEVQLPGDSPSVKTATKSAANELLSTCAQMANTEAPVRKDGEQIPTEVETSDQNIHKLVLTNTSKRQQQQPSADVSVNTNQPASASSSLGSDGLILVMANKNQPNITADTSQPTTASIMEQIPPNEKPFVSMNVEPPQESHNPPLHVDTNHFHPVPASVVEQAPSRESHIVTLNAEASRQSGNSQLSLDHSNICPVFSPRNASPHSNQPEPSVANNNNNRLVEDTPVLPNLVNSQAHLETPPSINGFMDNSRSHPMLQGARQVTPHITAQRLTSDPLYNEYERLCRESKRAVEVHEYMKLQLNSDCEKELAEIRKKYDLKLHDAEAAFSVKKKELEINSMKVLMNGYYAQSFQNMAEFKAALKLPQETSSNLTQQVHLPQAQPIFSPSTFTSSATVLSSCNRPNSPHIMSMLTPRPNFRANFIQSLPLHQQFRPQPPFSTTSFASVSQRAPAHREVPCRPTYQPVHFGMGPRSAARVRHPSLENPNLSQSSFFINLQNQMATHLPSVSTSVPTSASNLGMLSQVIRDNSGGSGITNMVNSGGVTGFICLSDDE